MPCAHSGPMPPCLWTRQPCMLHIVHDMYRIYCGYVWLYIQSTELGSSEIATQEARSNQGPNRVSVIPSHKLQGCHHWHSVRNSFIGAVAQLWRQTEFRERGVLCHKDRSNAAELPTILSSRGTPGRLRMATCDELTSVGVFFLARLNVGYGGWGPMTRRAAQRRPSSVIGRVGMGTGCWPVSTVGNPPVSGRLRRMSQYGDDGARWRWQ